MDQCAHCDEKVAGFRCPCDQVRYCNRVCQKRDWARHKPECPHARISVTKTPAKSQVRIDRTYLSAPAGYRAHAVAIESLVRSEFPNLEAKLRDNQFTAGMIDLVFRIPTSRQCFTITMEDTVETIRKRVTRSLGRVESGECGICLEEVFSYCCVCSKCDGSYCQMCFIRIFYTNSGIIKCPYCRNEFGRICSGYRGLAYVIQRSVLPVTETRSEMQNLDDRAQELYKTAVSTGDDLPDPATWIHNQGAMRASTARMRVMPFYNESCRAALCGFNRLQRVYDGELPRLVRGRHQRQLLARPGWHDGGMRWCENILRVQTTHHLNKG